MDINQKFSGDKPRVFNIEKMGDYIEGGITVGLSADDVQGILKGIGALKEDDRKELEARFQQIQDAKSDEEKKSLARKTCEFIRDRGLGIFDSLVAGGILVLASRC